MFTHIVGETTRKRLLQKDCAMQDKIPTGSLSIGWQEMRKQCISFCAEGLIVLCGDFVRTQNTAKYRIVYTDVYPCFRRVGKQSAKWVNKM